MAPDLVNHKRGRSEPQSSNQEWNSKARERLPVWKTLSVINERLQDDKLSVKVEARDDKMLVTYDPFETGSGYVSPAVI